MPELFDLIYILLAIGAASYYIYPDETQEFLENIKTNFGDKTSDKDEMMKEIGYVHDKIGSQLTASEKTQAKEIAKVHHDVKTEITKIADDITTVVAAQKAFSEQNKKTEKFINRSLICVFMVVFGLITGQAIIAAILLAGGTLGGFNLNGFRVGNGSNQENTGQQKTPSFTPTSVPGNNESSSAPTPYPTDVPSMKPTAEAESGKKPTPKPTPAPTQQNADQYPKPTSSYYFYDPTLKPTPYPTYQAPFDSYGSPTYVTEEEFIKGNYTETPPTAQPTLNPNFAFEHSGSPTAEPTSYTSPSPSPSPYPSY